MKKDDYSLFETIDSPVLNGHKNEVLNTLYIYYISINVGTYNHQLDVMFAAVSCVHSTLGCRYKWLYIEGPGGKIGHMH